jgi:RNA polymerase sigma-70 factor (sigma-E family)
MPDVDKEFTDFVRSRGDWLLRLAFLLTGDRHHAEDLMQDVLIGMYSRWGRIHESPEAYARTAMVNRANSFWRWRRRHKEASLADATEPVAPDHAGAVSGRGALVQALGTLSKQQRAAVVLRYLDELPIPEVAEILGCSEGAVKSHTARGLAKLRVVLDAHPSAARLRPAAEGQAPTTAASWNGDDNGR